MSSNFRGPTALSGFWKRRPESSDPREGPIVPTLDDDYPPPQGEGNLLKSVLTWTAATLGVIALLAAVLIIPGLVF